MRCLATDRLFTREAIVGCPRSIADSLSCSLQLSVFCATSLFLAAIRSSYNFRWFSQTKTAIKIVAKSDSMAEKTSKVFDDLDLPLEMTIDEYEDMITQVAALDEVEAKEEWLESSRFGEVDVLRALFRRFPSLINHVNSDTGNTALHMAAANGHTTAAQVLLNFKHAHTRNNSGNTPLHFAAINSQGEMVELLTTQKFFDVDVLEQNNFGRSSLTEGFSSQNEHVLKALLEHDSAEEERLLSSNGKSNTSVLHKFFDDKNPLRIRELAMTNADNPFADEQRPDQDTTGLSIWSASLVLARWLKTMSWDNCSVIELGAGCGVPGLSVATSVPPPRKVFVTDLNPATVDNLRHNILLNNLENTDALKMDWADKQTWPAGEFDFVVGADLIYQKSLVPLLSQVVKGLLKPGGLFLYVAPESGRDGLEEFIKTMADMSSECEHDVASDRYKSNPLANKDDDECFLHFQELSSLTFMLHKFRMK